MDLRKCTASMIYVLLLALIVSGGEGVRLFPIPVANSGTAKVGPGSATRYSLAAHRFSSATKYGQLKSLKKKASPEQANAGSVMPSRVNSARQALVTADFPSANLNYFDPSFRLPVGRAPPA